MQTLKGAFILLLSLAALSLSSAPNMQLQMVLGSERPEPGHEAIDAACPPLQFATLEQLQAGLQSGAFTSVDLVQASLITLSRRHGTDRVLRLT
jgi:hypothetical protein